MLMFLGVVVLLAGWTPLGGCDNLYITFHGGPTGYGNVGIYSLSGAYLGDLLLDEMGHDSLRGMAFWNSNLLICSAKDDRILLNSGCGTPNLTVFSHSPFLIHPYDLAIDTKLNRIYVSNQDGNNAIFFQNGDKQSAVNFTFGMTNPRGIDVDAATSRVYIASEDLQGVYVFEANGMQVYKYDVDCPVGVYVDSKARVLYVSNRGVAPGVYSFNVTTGQPLRYFPTPDSHPTGLLTSNSILYVLGQSTQSLQTFDLRTGAFLRTLTTFNSDYPEQIILGPCS